MGVDANVQNVTDNCSVFQSQEEGESWTWHYWVHLYKEWYPGMIHVGVSSLWYLLKGFFHPLYLKRKKKKAKEITFKKEPHLLSRCFTGALVSVKPGLNCEWKSKPPYLHRLMSLKIQRDAKHQVCNTLVDFLTLKWSVNFLDMPKPEQHSTILQRL